VTGDALGPPVTATSSAESCGPPITTTFGYDRSGRWKSTTLALRNAATSTTVVGDVGCNARGQRTRIVHGPGVTTTSSYDSCSFWFNWRHTARETSGTRVAIQDLRFAYAGIGNLLQHARLGPSNSAGRGRLSALPVEIQRVVA
jgi:hypothetical protein